MIERVLVHKKVFDISLKYWNLRNLWSGSGFRSRLSDLGSLAA